MTIPANGLLEYDICSDEGPLSDGRVTLNASPPDSIVANLLRIGKTPDGEDAYFLPSPMRAASVTAKVKNISEIPEILSVFAGNGPAANRIWEFAVNGTPPGLSDITSNRAEGLFWDEGVIDAITDQTASDQECEAFQEGMARCHAAQGLALTLGPVRRASSTGCYLRQLTSDTNTRSGAVSLEGQSPGTTDVRELFAPATGVTPRVIKIEPTGNARDDHILAQETAYLRIYTAAQNAVKGYI
jgi:hypothetical protein